MGHGCEARCTGLAPPVPLRADHVPDAASLGHTVRHFFEGERGAAHLLGRLLAKGRICSMWAIFSSNSLIHMASSPILDWSRSTSTLFLAEQGFNPDSPPSRSASRHLDNAAGVTQLATQMLDILAVKKTQHCLAFCFAPRRFSDPPSFATFHLHDASFYVKVGVQENRRAIRSVRN